MKKKIKRVNTNETKCETNKVHDEQSYDKKSSSDENQLLLWIKRMISLWTAMEINLAMFTVYVNDRVSNYYETNANFEIFLF